MKKKTKAAAPRLAKRGKSGVAEPKAAPRRAGRVKAKSVKAKSVKAKSAKAKSASAPLLAVAPDDAKPAIRRLRTQLAQALKLVGELQASADTDFLLNIPNRRGFERELNRAIAYIKRYHASGALIVLDVDRLKPINDAFGHAAGDQVLKAIVAELLCQVRSSDVIGRLGGDEFALLLWNLSETDAHAKAASLEQAIDRLTFVFRGRKIAAGASAGIAILGPHTEAGKALEQADSAMYVRKAQRRHEV
jgi:diguanylate cyclase (GGDEF)-like protein